MQAAITIIKTKNEEMVDGNAVGTMVATAQFNWTFNVVQILPGSALELQELTTASVSPYLICSGLATETVRALLGYVELLLLLWFWKTLSNNITWMMVYQVMKRRKMSKMTISI
ncbi:hypothetical protein Tco_0716860 [Tanacetum coccineum]